MIDDVKCPYCGAGQEINHDDGFGYEENVFHEQECRNCEKTFVFQTTISYYYEAYEAPCKNGGEHKLDPIHGHPAEIYKYRFRCEYCGEEVITDKEAHKQAWDKYFSDLAAQREANKLSETQRG